MSILFVLLVFTLRVFSFNIYSDYGFYEFGPTIILLLLIVINIYFFITVKFWGYFLRHCVCIFFFKIANKIEELIILIIIKL